MPTVVDVDAVACHVLVVAALVCLCARRRKGEDI